jgi:flotillin
MRFVKANPNEYLVVGRGGRITNRGVAASAFLWPGSTHVLIPSTQQEATFEMTQESKDSIPLRFKGIIIYRIVDPAAAARRFNFTNAKGHEQINDLLSHVCLGELRAVVAHLTMDECITQRKTTLTDAVATALRQVIQGREGDDGWGIALEVVQVAQVFIVDQELRRQLEAEVRNVIRVKSELSEIRTGEGIKLAQTTSERRLQQENLETERDKIRISGETFRLRQDLEREQIEAQTPIQLYRIEQEREVLKQQLEKLPLELRVKELLAQVNLAADKAKQDLRKEILPLEQSPAVAQALAGILRGVQLSVVGPETPLLAALTPLLNSLVRVVQQGQPDATTAGKEP